MTPRQTRPALALSLAPSDARPVFAQIADRLVEAIRIGRLSPGDKLPGSRSLAASLEVHRNTVLAAYEELFAQGWITGAAGKGTFVCRTLPEPMRRSGSSASGIPERPSFALAPPTLALRPSPPGHALPRGTLSIADGVPDLRLVPTAELSRAYRRVLGRADHTVMGYGFPRGHPRLREQIALAVNGNRGLAATPDDVLVTRGSQMGLYLAARTIVAPGSAVAVEHLGYARAWQAFRAAGANLFPVRVDEHGLRVDQLEELSRERQVSAVYVTPHHQYPTHAVLSADRRLALLELARSRRFAIIEDDYDNEIHFHGRPVLPLASADHAGSVVYVGTLSKILAPGLRIGYVVAPRTAIDKMAEFRELIDRQGDPAMELAVAELLEEGAIQRHARRVRRIYLNRRDALAESFRARLGDVLSFDVPAGGMAIWAAVAPDVDVEAWAERSLTAGVYFRSPRSFAFDGRTRPFLRASYAALTEKELDEAVKRMQTALASRSTR
jgi:GntR family transcriptional regulator/MocR family aminotransferase